MAFSIILQTMTSEKNKVDKNVNDVATVTGVLKEDCSIVDPVVIIEADLSSLLAVNYMTIPAFGRSYFLNPPVSIREGLVEISGHCDVLSSFKTAIRNNTAIIRKSENNWNLYLNDGTFKTYQNPFVYAKSFPNGFDYTSFILVVAGS